MIARRQCVLLPAHAIMAKSEATAAARRVGRVSVTAVSTTHTMRAKFKRAISRPSSGLKVLASASLSRSERGEAEGLQRVQAAGLQPEVRERVEPVADHQRAVDRRIHVARGVAVL